MLKLIARVCASTVSLFGLVLLGRALLHLADGSLTDSLFPLADASWAWGALALFLSLPIPLHVISIGLILQKKWLSPMWGRIAWAAILTSGCWLGIALVVKILMRSNP